MASFMSALSGAVKKAQEAAQTAQEDAQKEAQRRSGSIRSRQKYVDEDAAPVTVSRRGEGLGTGAVGKTNYSQPNANNAIKTINSNRAEQSPAPMTGGGIGMSTILNGIYGAPIGAYDDRQRIYGDAVASQLDRSRQLRDSALAARLGLGSTAMGRSTMSFKGGNALVSEAKKYLGTPYKWGGNSPEEGGMDCSGYMVKVYKDVAGIDLPRTTYEQVKQGTAVSKENLQPGDLVFFGSADNVHHVGMYIGNGQYIHEPKTGDVAKISDLNARKDFYGARRYTK